MCSKNILKSCDYITLYVNDAIEYTPANIDATGPAGIVGNLTWNIPRGVYRTVIKQPQITTVQVTGGNAKVDNQSIKSLHIEYVNSTMNQHTTRGSSVIAYGNVRAEPDSMVFVPNGEFVVGDRPEQIQLKIRCTEFLEPFLFSEIEGMVITLKFSYYDAKE